MQQAEAPVLNPLAIVSVRTFGNHVVVPVNPEDRNIRDTITQASHVAIAVTWPMFKMWNLNDTLAVPETWQKEWIASD